MINNPNWYQQSHENHAEFLRRAQAKGKLTSEDEIQNFLALAISGEAGELANIHKKEWRGDNPSALKIKADEAADIYIYLRHYAKHAGFDLDAAAAEKVAVVTERLKS